MLATVSEKLPGQSAVPKLQLGCVQHHAQPHPLATPKVRGKRQIQNRTVRFSLRFDSSFSCWLGKWVSQVPKLQQIIVIVIIANSSKLLNLIHKCLIVLTSGTHHSVPKLCRTFVIMFRVTPVPESRERKVSFSPDVDDSYRHQVVDKIKGLMEEVSVIHEKEEKQLKKYQEQEAIEFKERQQRDLEAFLKRQREESSGFQSNQKNVLNDLKERHTNETWRLFGRATGDSSRRGSGATITNLWGDQKNSEGSRSSQSSPSPWSPKPSESPMVAGQGSVWQPPNGSWNSSLSPQNCPGAQNWNSSPIQNGAQNSSCWNGFPIQNSSGASPTLNHWNKNS